MARRFFFNYGVASREKNTSVTETTLFELGSISKTFTATLAAYAQVLGKLSLDDHPSKYLPQLKGNAWGYDAQSHPIHVNPGVLYAQAYGVKSTAA